MVWHSYLCCAVIGWGCPVLAKYYLTVSNSSGNFIMLIDSQLLDGMTSGYHGLDPLPHFFSPLPLVGSLIRCCIARNLRSYVSGAP